MAAGVRPPRLLRAYLRRMLPPGDRDGLLVEMDELFARRAARDGRTRAVLWYLRQAAHFRVRLAGSGPGQFRSGATSRVQGVLRDVKYGVRVLLRRPAYALASIVTLGIGIGGVTAVYTVANWVLLRPVPGVATERRLATLQLEIRQGGAFAFPMSAPDLADLSDRIRGVRRLAASTEYGVHVEAAGGEPRRLSAEVVTANWFEVLGLRPELGRDQSGEAGTVVVSDRLWRQAWAGSRAVLGSDVRINGHLFRVAGVAPSGFRGADLPGEADLWLPASAFPVVDPSLPADVLERRSETVWRDLVGELTPDATPDAIGADAERAIAAIRETYGGMHSFRADFVVRTYPGVGLAPRIRGNVRRTLGLLGATAAILLLLALANVTNLALAHGAGRSGQIAVHAALGASRTRLVQRALIEHLLLGLAGAAAGTGVAFLALRLFRHASLSSLGASLTGVRPDWRVLAFTLAVAVAAGMLAGVVPALATGRVRLLGSLHGIRHGRRRSLRLQSGLVVVQVALSTLLLVGAGLLVRSVLNLRATSLGFEPEHALRYSMDPRVQGYDDARTLTLVRRAVRRLESIAGVEAAGFIAPSPVSESYFTMSLYPAGGSKDDDAVHGAQFQATGRFLEAMGAKLIAGRSFRDDERTPGDSVSPVPVVITRALARQAFPDLPPDAVIGRSLLQSFGKAPPALIVGVIEDLRLVSLSEASPPIVLYPWRDGYGFELTGWVRTGPRPESMIGPVSAALRNVDPELPEYDMAAARDRVDGLIVEERVVARLALALAAVGLLLTGVGLQGVLGYAVTQRRREIGVRAALGATPGAILGAFVRRGLLLTALGGVVGVAAATAATRIIRARLYGVTPLDPPTYVGGAVLLLAMAALAVWGPARRSTRVAPTEALVAE